MRINEKTFENTIRVHGILLEYEVQRKLKEILSTLEICGRALLSSHRSKTFVFDDPKQRRETAEVDVYLEYSYSCEELINVYLGEERLTSVDRPNLIDYLIIECKGHESGGFLLTNDTKRPADFLVQFATHQDMYSGPQLQDFPNIQQHIDVDKGIVFLDWAYFYQGKTTKIEERDARFYKQDKEGKENKFLTAVEQLNRALKCFMFQKEECQDRNTLHRICPIIVTNASIYSMRVRSYNVDVYKGIPWAMYRNASKREHFPKGYPFFDYFYVVNSDHLQEFIENYIGIVKENERMEYRTKPSIFHRFRI